MRYLTGLLAAGALTACAAPAPTPGTPVPDTHRQLCNFTMTDASAWIDRMPGPGGPSGNLVVMVEVENDGTSRRFESRGMRGDGTLLLDVVEWGPDAGLNKITYRSKGLSPERVEIRCAGAPVTTVDVMKVY
ncbi:hypothetical protein [Henriciella sp.]|uniref:hypothetical protein n=1 Tax=Henriciella sp. TaxID=1968823 RepID=UPI0026156EFB|nr:hypothetical protein [Henriciella sp.]